jgi:hypothetical protein
MPPEMTAKRLTKPDKPFALKPRDEPAYDRYTPEQKDWFWQGLYRQQGIWTPIDMPRRKYPLPPIMQKTPDKQVDPDSEPFREIYEGNEGDNFSGAEVVNDQNVWFWVQRILPNNNAPDYSRSNCRDRMPSGWIPAPVTPPDRTYFVRRQWNGLFPVSKHLTVKNQKVVLKRIDEHFFDLTPDVYTLIELVDGDIRDLEMEVVEHIQNLTRKRILSSVSEIEGKITLKGDHVEEVVRWLEQNGF